MRIYLIAAEGDADIAEECSGYLRRHGCTVRFDPADMFVAPARPGEMTLALWSMKTRMSSRQIMFTNRAIDALMTGSLVVGQLDFHPLPYGLTDVDPYDLRNPGMRQFQITKLLADLRKIERAQQNDRRTGDARGHEDDEAISDLVDSLEDADEEDPNASDVFVSYSFANSDIVLPMVDDMQETGTQIWIDREQLKPGMQWAGNIVRAIKATDIFCLMCSAQSFASDHVRREIYLADKYDKPILPVMLDAATMPEDIEYFLIDRQFLDMTRIEDEARGAALRGALTA